MFTPLTPRLLFILTLMTMASAAFNPGIGQKVRLYPLKDYEASLRAYYTAKVKTQCTEFEQKTKMKWWYYLPTIGFQFGLPSINAGTNQLVTIDQTRQQNRVKLTTIITQGLLDYRTDLHQLRSMYASVQIMRDEVDELMTSWKTEEKIFQITQEAHNKEEVKPLDYYKALLVLQRAYSTDNARNNTYANKVIELARFARFDFPTEDLPGLDSLFKTVSKPRPNLTQAGW